MAEERNVPCLGATFARALKLGLLGTVLYSWNSRSQELLRLSAVLKRDRAAGRSTLSRNLLRLADRNSSELFHSTKRQVPSALQILEKHGKTSVNHMRVKGQHFNKCGAMCLHTFGRTF